MSANLIPLTSDGGFSTAGNVTGGNISATGKITGGSVDTVNLVVNNISSDDSTLVSIQDGLQVYGSVTADNIGNVASINLDGNVSNVLSGLGTWIAGGGGGGGDYANANVAAYGEAGWAGNIIPSANATYTLGNSTMWWSNAWFASNTIYIGGVPLGVSSNELTVNGNTVVTANATGTSTTTGNVSITGNVSAGNIIATNVGNVAALNLTGSSSTVLYGNGTFAAVAASSSYGNANVVANLAALSSNPVSSTGNVTAGNLVTAGLATVTGNVQAGNVRTAGLVSATGNITGGNVLTGGVISATGNITGAFIKGNGSELTNLPAPTVAQDITSTGDMSIMTYDGNLKYVNYATVEPSTGNIKTSGNISATGNIIGGNIRTAGLISATGNIIAGNLDAVNLVINNISSDNSTIVSVQDGLQVYGNIIADNIGTVAAVDLDGNVSNVLSGSGTWIAAGSGGNANTGNVTFDDVNIIGTGNLNLQPDPADAGAYLNIYLTAGPDIHISGGSGYSGAVILGTDEEANVAILPGGNVAIQAGNVSGTKTWTFDTAGNLTLPMGGVVYETNIPDGALSGSAIALKPTGGTTANQQLLIYPTANDGDHIHLTSGNLYTTELFLGSDNFYVKLANTGNVVINSNDGNSSNAMWTFGTDGNLTVPGTVTAAAGETLILQAAPGQNADLMSNNGNNVVYVNDTAAYVQTVDGVGTVSLWTFDTAGNLSAPGNVSAVGNVTGAYIVGNGSALTSITGANVSGTVTSATTAATVTTAAQPNITSVGTLTSVTVTGNATMGNLITSGGNIFGANNVSANTFSALGNVTVGGLTVNGAGVVTGNLQVQGNLTYNNLTNLTTANLVFGLANTTTGISTTGSGFVVGNTNEATFLYNYSTQAWNSNIGISAAGNVAGGNIRTTGLISATGNLTAGNVSATNLTGTLATAAQTNITSVGTLSTLSASGNVTGGNVLTAGIVSATGNITGNFILGNGSQLSGIITSVANINSGTSNVTVVSSGGNVTVGVGGTSNVAVFATTGEYVTGVVSASGNVTGGNLLTGGIVSSTGNITGGNIRTAGVISSTGNITGGNVGATLLSGTTVSVTGNVTGGNITTVGIITATGNITGGNISATNHTGTTVSVTGNVTGGNITTAGQVSATGNITTANSFVGNLVGTTVSVTGNVSAGNVIVNGQPTTYGYVNGAYLLAQNTTDQSVGLNGVVNFQTTNASNGSIITKTSNSQVTLAAGNTYKLEAIVRRLTSSSTWGAVRWYDVTNAAYVGIEGFSEVVTGSSAIGSTNVATAYVTPSVNTTYELRQTTVNTISVSANYATIEITQVNPAIAVQATATGTVSATVGNVTLSNSYSQVVAASSPGTTIFTLPTLQPGTYLITARAKYNGGYSVMGIFTGGSQVANTSAFSWYQTSGSVNNGLNGTWVLTVTTPTVYTINVWGGGTVSAGSDGSAVANYIKIDSTFALNTLATMSLTGNITTTGNVSATGNVYGTNLTDKTTSSWTVATGTNTYSITVPINGNYQLWVRCNIPNGIFAYQATVSVTNTNVPVLGTQRACNYTGGGSPILLTTMPTQIVGADGTISTAVVATTTANRFDFVINNTSGSSQTVYWGYVTL